MWSDCVAGIPSRHAPERGRPVIPKLIGRLFLATPRSGGLAPSRQPPPPEAPRGTRWLARREQNKVWRRLGLEFCIQHFIACRMLRLIHRPDRVKESLKNRQLGFIDYNGDINVHRSLLGVISATVWRSVQF
jgi:hypothetical protein